MLVSFLLPTRARPTWVIKTLESVIHLARDTSRFEVLLAHDQDDQASKEQIERHFQNSSVQIKHFVFSRHGYKNLHKYVNALCEQSSARVLWLWNDDCIMQTRDWDVVLQRYLDTYDSDFFVAKMSTNSPNNIFPLVSKSVYDFMGHFSLNAHNDTYVNVVAQHAGILQDFADLQAYHFRNEVGNDVTYIDTNTDCRITMPTIYALLKSKDLEKLGDRLRAHIQLVRTETRYVTRGLSPENAVITRESNLNLDSLFVRPVSKSKAKTKTKPKPKPKPKTKTKAPPKPKIRTRRIWKRHIR